MEETDEHQRSSPTRAVGFNLLPTDLIHTVFLHLALPEIPRLRPVCKLFWSVTSDPSFLRHYNSNFRDAPWLFLYAKRWGQDAVLKGIATGSARWFNFSIRDFLAPVVHRSDDVYFLTASGNIFLFAVNTIKEIVSVNLMNMSVHKIPPSPLGPRDTSSWRRSGMKLVAGAGGADHFRFFFLEYVQNRGFWFGEDVHVNLFLFEYDSLAGKWQSTEVQEHGAGSHSSNIRENPTGFIFLSVANVHSENIMVAIGLDPDRPIVVLSPSFRPVEDRGFAAGPTDYENEFEWVKIWGDGTMLRLKSANLSGSKKVIVGLELWGCLGSNGRHWELISRVPSEFLARRAGRPYGAMRGCLERRRGTVRAALMSNCDGSWDIMWLSYEVDKREWSWSVLPDCNMMGANMGGMSFSYGLTLA